MAAYHAEYLCDLAKPSQVIAIPYVFAMGDNQSHTFTALVYDSDNPQGGLLAGSVAGLVVRPDGGTVPLIGTKESAVREIALPDGTTVQATACTITLIQGCFACAGQIVIVIRLVDGETQTAVFAGRGNVTRSLTDTIVDPGDVVTDISTLIAEAESAAADAEEALEQAGAVVTYAAQTGKTDAEKAQARENIGAPAAVLHDGAVDQMEVGGTTYDVQDSKAQEVVGTISEATGNLFDESVFVGVAGITKDANGYWTGTAGAFNTAFGFAVGGVSGIAFESGKRYTASVTAYTDGNQSTGDTNGLVLSFYESSATAASGHCGRINLKNNMGSTAATSSVTSTSGKNVSFFAIGYANIPDNIWHIKNIIITEGTDAVDYYPHWTAVDRAARTIVNAAIGGGATTITSVEANRKAGYYAYNSSSGKVGYAASTNYYTVDPVDISLLKPGTTVRMNASLNGSYGIFITDSAMNMLDYINGSNAEARGYSVTSQLQLVSLTVPQNAKYIMTDLRTSYVSAMSAFDVTGILIDNVTILEQKVEELAGMFDGKKWVACGDSFTAGAFSNSTTNNYTFTSGLYAGNYKVYPFWIGRRNPGLTVINEAIAGSTMGGGDGGVNPFSGTRYTSIPADTDYITLEFGINDVGEVPIGTIDDADNTTFYGAWNVVLGYLIEHFPFAHIGIIVGPGMQTSDGQDYAHAEIAVAKKWGIPYLNVQFESGGQDIPLMLRTSNPDVAAAVKAIRDSQQFVNTSVETPNHHPNENAHELESNFIEAFLRRI